jgi:hypothetical protein
MTKTYTLPLFKILYGAHSRLLQRSAARLERREASPNEQVALLSRYVVIWALGSFLSAVYSVFFLGWDLVTQLPSSLSLWLYKRLRERQRRRERQIYANRKELDYELQRTQTDELNALYERKQSSP